MKHCTFAIITALAVFGLPATAATASQTPGIELYDGATVAAVIHVGDQTPIAKAAELLVHDLSALTGARPRLESDFEGLSGPGVIVGLADTPEIAALLETNEIDAAPIAGKWETYGRAAIPAPWDEDQRALLIFGSDVRGAIWGVIDLTREMGVSPWEWWADVAIREVERIEVDGSVRHSREPSVKYRAIFLNDEDFGLFPWAAQTYDPELGDIGPKTYARIYELLWRLKANAIWPAMHDVTTPFNHVPGNPEMAASYAIVHATSHAEPMLRNNVGEWDHETMGDFNYVTNKQRMLAYWDERAEESSPFENIYTVGLRGIHDSPMEGATGAQSAAELLEDVIAEQRRILEHRLDRPAHEIPQAFTAYKEVLIAYDAGLELPQDITITWPDDNHGYIRRLSDARERQRNGGSGVYYHISYWGAPHSYLWLATTHPMLVWEELNKAWRFDARRIWVINVGDIKPAEYLTQLSLDLAFDAESYPDPASVRAHLRRWTEESFGAAHADEITDILWRSYDLAFERRPEFMGWNQTYPTTVLRPTAYNPFAFGDELQRRLDAYRAIADRAKRLRRQLPSDRQDAFYQLVEYPVTAAAGINERVLYRDKSIAYGLQRRASANDYARRAKAAEVAIVEGSRYYNETMSHGKWRGMMSITPHGLPVFAAPALPSWSGPRDTGCAVQTEGGDYYEGGGSTPALPPFYPELSRSPSFDSRYIDVFVKSPVAARWTAVANAPWIKLSQTEGELAPGDAPGQTLEQRLHVSIDWTKAPEPGWGRITIRCDTEEAVLPVAVRIAPRQVDASFIEADRRVSIYATHADSLGAGWEVLDGLGHTGASLRSKLDLDSIDPATLEHSAKGAPSATYRFATHTAEDVATLRLVALPTHPITSENGLRVAVSIDGEAPVVLDLATAEFSAQWRQNVLSNTAVAEIGNVRLEPGVHELKVYALDPGLTLDRFEVAFAGAPRAYGTPPETRVVNVEPGR